MSFLPIGTPVVIVRHVVGGDVTNYGTVTGPDTVRLAGNESSSLLPTREQRHGRGTTTPDRSVTVTRAAGPLPRSTRDYRGVTRYA